MGKITDKGFVTTLTDDYSVFLNAGNSLKQMTVKNFRQHLNDNDAEVLNDLAFGFAVNEASASGAARVDTYGNDHMRAIWEDMKEIVLMDKNGNFCPLNKKDAHFLENGTQIADTTTHALTGNWANADVMVIIPEHYGRIQTVVVGNNTYLRPWFSPVPLPGGYVIPQQVVGKFKASKISNALRSVPNQVPHANIKIDAFWSLAQTRSKNHGLANLDFRNYLLVHMMSKYGWRDSQGCKNSDNSLVWGVGLDGTESTLQSGQSDKFAVQKNIVTGATLALGVDDGKSAVADANGDTCHSVNVAGFENPWGQYWEMVGGLCSVGSTVYCWRSNFIPPTSSNPTAATFAKVPHVELTRPTAENNSNNVQNIIASQDGQGLYFVPQASVNAGNITYNDHYYYAANGQLWLFGGTSNYAASCGLAFAYSSYVWSHSNASVSARLAFYGEVTRVSAERLAELLAA